MSTAKQADPLKALLRERDLATLKKKLLKEGGIIRLRALEGLVENHGHRLALVERNLQRLSKFQKDLAESTPLRWKQKRML